MHVRILQGGAVGDILMMCYAKKLSIDRGGIHVTYVIDPALRKLLKKLEHSQCTRPRVLIVPLLEKTSVREA